MGRIAGCISFAILTVSFVFSAQSQEDERSPVVAIIGPTTIEADAFRTRYIDHLLTTGLQDSPVRRASFLNGLVAMRLIVLEAEAQGISDQPEYQKERESVVAKLLIEAYTQEMIYGNVQVSSEDLEDMFVRTKTQLTVRHLYARTRSDADVLLSRLEAGEDFEALAAETFADSTLARTGGRIGPFTFDEMDPAFEDAAFQLSPGEISSPIQTATGYSIIQLLDRFQEPILTETEFAQRKDKLASYVRHRKQQAARRKHVQDLAAGLRIRFEDQTLNRLLLQITGQRLAPDDEDGDSWIQELLVSYENSGRRILWTVEEFRNQAWQTDDDQRAQVRTREDLVDFVTGLVAREVIIQRALSLGLKESPAFDQAFRYAMEQYTYANALDKLRSSVADRTGDEELYLRSHVLNLRQRYPVKINGDVLAELPLIENESS